MKLKTIHRCATGCGREVLQKGRVCGVCLVKVLGRGGVVKR